MNAPLQVAVVADLTLEGWTSMDLVADMLVANLGQGDIAAHLIRPSLAPRGHRLGRYVNRFWDYPRWLRKNVQGFDVFHVVDHSYAHVVHVLDGRPTVVTCHDTDAFLPLVAPGVSSSRLPTPIVKRILSGMQKATCVACPSKATRDELLAWSLVQPDCVVVVPNGVHPVFAFRADPRSDAAVAAIIGSADTIDLLHVGSCIARKRIDRLLEIVAAVRHTNARVRLLKAGGTLTAQQRAMANRLGLTPHIVQLPHLPAEQLASLYRRAALVLAPSDREGFGLPVAEALACGTTVIASDLPVFREVGGSAAYYRPPDDVAGWADLILSVIEARERASTRDQHRERSAAQGGRYSWRAYADGMLRLYRDAASKGAMNSHGQPARGAPGRQPQTVSRSLTK